MEKKRRDPTGCVIIQSCLKVDRAAETEAMTFNFVNRNTGLSSAVKIKLKITVLIYCALPRTKSIQ